MANTTNFEGAALAEFAYNKMHWRTAYVITDTTIQYTKGIAQYTSQVFKQLGGKVVGQDTMSNADQSIAAQITRLKAVKPAPDFVVLSSFNPGLAAAVKQVRAAGVNLPLIGGAGWDGTYWLKGIPKFSNAYHGALGFVERPRHGQGRLRGRRSAYKKAYGSPAERVLPHRLRGDPGARRGDQGGGLDRRHDDQRQADAPDELPDGARPGDVHADGARTVDTGGDRQVRERQGGLRHGDPSDERPEPVAVQVRTVGRRPDGGR